MQVTDWRCEIAEEVPSGGGRDRIYRFQSNRYTLRDIVFGELENDKWRYCLGNAYKKGWVEISGLEARIVSLRSSCIEITQNTESASESNWKLNCYSWENIGWVRYRHDKLTKSTMWKSDLKKWLIKHKDNSSLEQCV